METIDPPTIGIRKLGNGKSYVVTWADQAQGLLHYRKVDGGGKPYEVGYDDLGQTFCTCKGFQFRSKCVHSADFAELGPELIDVKPKEVVRYPIDHFHATVLQIETMLKDLSSRVRLRSSQSHVAGSYRRGKSHIRDLDFVTTATTDSIINHFSSDGIEVKVHGNAVCRFNIGDDDPFMVDIISTEAECFGAALLHATGSKEFNIHLRRRAKRDGYKLNRHGLFERESEIRYVGESEEAVLSALGYTWIPAEDRENLFEGLDTASKEDPWQKYLKR